MTDLDPQVELRLALAMRGGVSLAVWIGGACAEIDQLRRCAHSPDSFWADLLHSSSYSTVSVDILAGASAGGLNGVLYAASQVYDFPFAEMREFWLRDGGTEGLVRRTEVAPSLFRGDDYFEVKLFEALRDLGRRPEPAGSQPTASVELALSATLIEPVERPLASPSDEVLYERRYGSGFRFRRPVLPWTIAEDDFPPSRPTENLPEDYEAAMRRLALAGRATSSYPGAFEAATMRATRGSSFDSRPSPVDTSTPIDMGGVLAERGIARVTAAPAFLSSQATEDEKAEAQKAAETFVVADGGILDNIPIARALNAVAEAPADSRTERFLVYLQPGAPSAPKLDTPPTPIIRTDSWSVLHGALAAKVTGETINDDIDEIEAYNESIARAAAIRAGVFAPLIDSEALVGAAAVAYPSYLRSRAWEDARRIFRVLSDPIGVLGADPFPVGLGSTAIGDAVWRSPMAHWPAVDRELFAADLERSVEGSGGQLDPDTVFRQGVKPLARVVQLLIEWTRFRERYLPPADAMAATEAKAKLYRVLAFLTAAIDRPRDLAWISAIALRADKAPSATDIDTIRKQVDEFVCFPTSDADAVAAALSTGRDDGLADARTAAVDRVASVVNGDALAVGTDLRPLLLDVVMAIVDPLRALTLHAVPIQADPSVCLDRVLTTGGKPSKEILAALEVMCFGEFSAGLPGRRGIHFVRLSSANRTPIAPAFQTVLKAAAERHLWWDKTNADDWQKQEGIHVNLKLAGNELANFSAFLVPKWRANDWLWGRLDAVVTLVDLLVTPASVRQLARGKNRDALTEYLLNASPLGEILDDEHMNTWRTELQTEVDAVLRGYNPPIPTIRNCLIATRQWAILREELALPQSLMEQARRPSDVQLPAEAISGRFGSETISDNDHAQELTERFGELSRAAGNTVVWSLQHSPVNALHLSNRPAQLIRWAVTNVVTWMTTRLTRPARSSQRDRSAKRRSEPLAASAGVENPAASPAKRRVLVAAIAAAAVGAGAFGFVSNRSAFLIGLGLGIALVVPLAVLIWWWLRRLFHEPPPVSFRDGDTVVTTPITTNAQQPSAPDEPPSSTLPPTSAPVNV